MSLFNDLMYKLMGQTDEAKKAALDTEAMSAATVVQLDFAQYLTLVNDPQTPILNAVGSVPVQGTQHKWREATIRAGASNASKENSAAKSGVSVTPAMKSNTCQIIKGTVEISNSAIQEAENGLYGTDLQNMSASQIEMEMAGIAQDIETAFLYGVEDTSDAGNARAMKGLIGLVGTWNGSIQTTRTNAAGAAFAQALIDTLLGTIWALKPRQLPTALVGSLTFCTKVSGYLTSMRYNISSPEELARVPAGQRVTQYVAPWGGILDMVPHPDNTNDAVAANNWFGALCLPNVKKGDFRTLRSKKLTNTTDGEQYEILWEGTLEHRNEKASGIVRNFVQIS